MTNQEFSDSFDTLLSSYTTNSSIELDEYEKSVFLTQAQENLVLAYYTGKNSMGDNFESSEEIRRYLGGLIKTAELPIASPSTTQKVLNTNSKVATLPTDLWFITYEAVKMPTDTTHPRISGKTLEVTPVTQDEFHRIVKDPFKNASARRVLRLDFDGGTTVELVFEDFLTDSKYIIRYLSKLTPIVLTALPDGLKIGGISAETPCSLHEALHKSILEEAVRLALVSKGIQYKNQS